jgi:hypothetical protein
VSQIERVAAAAEVGAIATNAHSASVSRLQRLARCDEEAGMVTPEPVGAVRELGSVDAA